MPRAASGAATVAVLLATLAGCGQSEYCKAVEENQETLNSLGEKKSNAAFMAYARSFRAVASVAPPGIRDDWSKLADVTMAVVAAHKKAGIALEDMTNDDKLVQVPPERLKPLNDAYVAFNGTREGTHAERQAVIRSAKDECEITLS